jgi:hypothetical protein
MDVLSNIQNQGDRLKVHKEQEQRVANKWQKVYRLKMEVLPVGFHVEKHQGAHQIGHTLQYANYRREVNQIMGPIEYIKPKA